MSTFLSIQIMYTHHPDIYTLIELLKQIQIDIIIAIQTVKHEQKKIGTTSEKITFTEENINRIIINKSNHIRRINFIKIITFKH